eukprot:11839848-Alexandrium_andersonii.AAC.1
MEKDDPVLRELDATEDRPHELMRNQWEGRLEVEEDRDCPRMLERIALHGALGLDDVVVHRPA